MSTSEKQNVALVSMAASAGLAIAKLVAGVLTGSLAILSEAIQNIIDFGATVVTYFAIRWGDRPADHDHHYGHAKIESVAALIEAGLLFLTMAWIVWEAVSRYLEGSASVEVTWWAVAIITMSVAIDYNRARALSRVAVKTSSEALAADALHFSADMWSSLVVLAGLAGVAAGIPVADSIAAVIVAVFVGVSGWRLAARTLHTLLDTAPLGATEIVRALVTDVDGVLAIKALRLRPAGATLFVSIVVEVARTMPIDDIVKTKETIHDLVRGKFPNADITVTANPVPLDSETVFQRVMLIASRRNQAIHHLTVQQINGKLAVSFDLEVDGAMPLGQAHDAATSLEDSIRRELGSGAEVESHIEPQPERLLEGHDAGQKLTSAITATLLRLAAKHQRLTDIHNIRVRQNDEGVFLHYHCRCAANQTIERVHDDIDRVEAGLKEKYPDIRRVIAHAEPLGYRRHKL